MKTFILFFVGVVVGISLYQYLIFPHMIDKRANALGLTQYSYVDGRMVGKGETKWILHYLKTGTMN